MSGIKIRLSRFTSREAVIGDFSAAEASQLSSAAMLLYPNQVPAVSGQAPGYSAPVLLVRLTDWTGDDIVPLCGAKEAAALGGDGCVVDLVSGYEGSHEIASMRFLARAVEETHCLGLPVIARIRFNPAGRQEALADCLEIPLAAAEEIGVDAVILPEEAGRHFSPSYRPSLPLFLAGHDGLIRRLCL